MFWQIFIISLKSVRFLIAISCLITCFYGQAQYFLRGEIKDEQNNPLANVKIISHSNGNIYYSGGTGGFGILLNQQTDTFTFSLDGYYAVSIKVDSRKTQQIVLKQIINISSIQKKRLLSFTKDFKIEEKERKRFRGETYSSLIENDFVPADKFPQTAFALTGDKASYSNIRRFLNMQTTVPPDAVRIEEMLNYFNFGYTNPHKDSLFHFQSALSESPWNKQRQLLYLQVSAKKIDTEKIPHSNLVFLIDVSGSMDMPNRLPLLKSAFKLLVNNLREKDTVSIVVYGSTVGIWLPPTSGGEKNKIFKAIEDLNPGGATPGESGIRTAYRLAKSQYIKGGNNRVILATDGDFNVGQSSEDELEKLIVQHQQWGIYLTCLGVGMGNYKDSKLEILAKKGNGNFAYLDDEREAEKVLVKEFTQTLYTVANNVYLEVNFNHNVVSEYRLIGFDNKANALADSVSKLEGGEIGSGYSLMALFEIIPSFTSKTNLTSPPKLAEINLRYRLSKDGELKTASYSSFYVPVEFKNLPAPYRLASTVALFGGLLKKSAHFKPAGWNTVLILANQSYDPNDPVQKRNDWLNQKSKENLYKRKKASKSFYNSISIILRILLTI